ncbi:hypothetical protein [Solilutibacter pythonis]|uniref:hypothetical protein n=1 Tax=Solilutibacter pythonis TaxID=2483112 RepID=UPI001FE69D3F|nr:hypothetical protein [Lysobacter pythonis]
MQMLKRYTHLRAADLVSKLDNLPGVAKVEAKAEVPTARRMRQRRLLDMGNYTYEMVVKYEVARDLLNGRITTISEQIAEEEARAVPDTQLIEQLEELMTAIGASISELDVTDEARLDAVIAAHSKSMDM